MYHLAQLNVGRVLAPMDDPLMEGFASRLDELNMLAERSPGFVWRLQSESGNATDIQTYADPLMLVNMSLWESVEALSAYVYNSEHINLMRQRRSWFERPAGAHMVLWWVSKGRIPSVDEAKARLAILERRGPCPEAFTFRDSFPPPDA